MGADRVLAGTRRRATRLTPVQLGATPVGRYELARVTSIDVNVLALDHALQASFDAGLAQVLYVPEFTSLVVQSGRFDRRAVPWDPVTHTGGIVAFLCSSEALINGTIDANGAGFRGGAYADDGPARNLGCVDASQARDGRRAARRRRGREHERHHRARQLRGRGRRRRIVRARAAAAVVKADAAAAADAATRAMTAAATSAASAARRSRIRRRCCRAC